MGNVSGIESDDYVRKNEGMKIATDDRLREVKEVGLVTILVQARDHRTRVFCLPITSLTLTITRRLWKPNLTWSSSPLSPYNYFLYIILSFSFLFTPLAGVSRLLVSSYC